GSGVMTGVVALFRRVGGTLVSRSPHPQSLPIKGREAQARPPRLPPPRGEGGTVCVAHSRFPTGGTSPLAGEARRGVFACVLAMLATILFSITPAFAQNLPYHADPDAREILPLQGAVPAIRFLTTADFPPFNFRDESGELIG